MKRGSFAADTGAGEKKDAEVLVVGPRADAWNIEEVGRSDPADQRGIGKWGSWPHTEGRYLFAGGDAPDRCFMAFDLKDPAHPKVVTTVYSYDPIKSPTPPPKDPRWSQTTPVPGWDPAWNTHTHYVQQSGNILVVNQERSRAGSNYQDNLRGIKVYDISNPREPKCLSFFALPGKGKGVHHFFYDGRYAYLGAEYEGFIDKILVIVDLKDPRNPVEVGKWWVPGQKTPEEDAIRDWVPASGFRERIVWIQVAPDKWLPKKYVGMHWLSVQGTRAYLAYHHAGVIILDISDKRNPKFISRFDYHFPPKTPHEDPNPATNWHGGNTHMVKPIPGRQLLGVTDELQVCPYGWVRFIDISDESKPQIISEFKYPENRCPNFPRGFQPYAHMANAWGSNLWFVAWPALGLRVIDISNPRKPVEVGHYVPPVIGSYTGLESQTQGMITEYRDYVESCDVVFGPGGLLYLSDAKGGGVRVLKYTGPGAPTE